MKLPHVLILVAMVLVVVLGIAIKQSLAPAPSAEPPPVTANPVPATDGDQPKAKPLADLPGDAPMIPSSAQALQALMQQQQERHERKRYLHELTAEQRGLLAKAALEIGTDLSTEDKLALLRSVEFIHSPELLDIVNKALDDKSSEVRLAALELLRDFDSNAILPIVEKAMDDKDDTIREAAVSSLYYVDDPQVGTLLAEGLDDDAEHVRKAAMTMAEAQPADTRFKLYAKALQSTHRDVQFDVITQLQTESSHQAMDVLLEGLKHPDERYREEVAESINFLISHRFTSYEEAKAWWEKNKHRYNDELFDKDALGGF